jgi:hypothetical protein
MENLLTFANQNLDGLKKYMEGYLVWSDLSLDELMERKQRLSDVTEMIVDGTGMAVTPNTGEIGVSFMYATDEYENDGEEETEVCVVNGVELRAIWYNI